jgi:hypothetical protein
MKALTRAARAAFSLAALALFALPGTATAQSQPSDAYVLRPGQLRLQVGAVYTGYDQRFGASGSEPLAAPLRQPLTAATFAPLAPLSADIANFLAATASQPGAGPVALDDSTFTLGTPDIQLFESLVRTPLQLSLGILPRLEIGVSVPILRGEQMLQRFTLADGTLGANPDADANAALLARIGAQWEALGRSAFLPTEGSELGMELQARVSAATGGDSLQLPTLPGDTTLFQGQLLEAFGVPGIRSRIDRYRLGDVQLLARMRLLSTFGDAPIPPTTARGLHLRSTLIAGLRLPTGSASDTVELLPFPYDIGFTGYSAGVVNDIFVGQRVWTTAGIRMVSLGSAEVMRVPAPPSSPLSVLGPPSAFRITRGSELEVRIAPRIRLLEAVSLGAEYLWESTGATRLEAVGEGGTIEVEGGSGQRLGIGLLYSTLPAFAEGRSGVPVEVELRYQRSLAGPAGVPDTGFAVFEARVLPRLWGR